MSIQEQQQFINKLFQLTENWLPEVIELHRDGYALGCEAQIQIKENDFGGLLSSLERLGNILLSLEYHNQRHMEILEEAAEDLGISDLLEKTKQEEGPKN